ncbi:GntR family transcriptional regulator [Actinosynnema pretiosum subsp. pretiosum]|uniref:Transcriptional regulator, GntR family n=2 Tax=Actinosynnema TaxID=40566 RepID=C6WL56_ACTMD|nr:GntR family transcriptional regulator [Actinosynnema mirum]ACU36409.1 transcriptional regulator, GntR family [Actinosynnema mirum DSM 43827]QUF05941.1 GntR family transcriptional regulator [Actinosynnema pretiosum subsp. pretiosum]
MTNPAPAPVTKSDLAYAQVRGRVLSGALAPGAVVNQAALAVELGISTTPLREALKRLSAEGLVELGAHRDARVAPLSGEEARDLLEVRRALDPLAAGLAAERRTRADVAEIRRAHDALRPLGRGASTDDLATHRRFHAAVYRASQNEVLVASLDALWDKSDRYRALALREGRDAEELARRAAEHAALVDLVVEGDAVGASALMRGHVDTSLGARAALRLLGGGR